MCRYLDRVKKAVVLTIGNQCGNGCSRFIWFMGVGSHPHTMRMPRCSFPIQYNASQSLIWQLLCRRASSSSSGTYSSPQAETKVTQKLESFPRRSAIDRTWLHLTFINRLTFAPPLDFNVFILWSLWLILLPYSFCLFFCSFEGWVAEDEQSFIHFHCTAELFKDTTSVSDNLSWALAVGCGVMIYNSN